MDPLEREDSSTYKQQSTDTPQEPVEAPQRPVMPQPEKPKKSRAPLVLTLLLLLALAAAGVFGWLWYQQNGRVSDLESDLAKTRNDVARLESAAKAEEATDESDDVTTSTTDSDSEAAIKEALSYAKAMLWSKGYTLDGKLAKQTDEFALVTVSSSAGSGATAYYLKKVDDVWLVIGDSSDNTDNSLSTEFGLPKDFI